MRIAVVVGNPKPESRTLTAANAVADAIEAAIGGAATGGTATGGTATGGADRLVVDVTTLGSGLLDWASIEVGEMTAAVAASDLVVVASPTYKATYTGLLKLFLDRYGNNGLAGTVAVPMMTGAAPIHALAPETHLRPLLTELGASVPTRSVYLMESTFDDLPAAIGPWVEVAGPLLARALAG